MPARTDRTCVASLTSRSAWVSEISSSPRRAAAESGQRLAMSDPSWPLLPMRAMRAMLFALRTALVAPEDVVEAMETGVHLGQEEHPVDVVVAGVAKACDTAAIEN